MTLQMKKPFCAVAISLAISATGSAALDTAKIDEITGLKGKLNEKEAVYKITSPRGDVKVSVDGWTMRRSWDSAPGPRLPAKTTRRW
jgi:hypothetical protein